MYDSIYSVTELNCYVTYCFGNWFWRICFSNYSPHRLRYAICYSTGRRKLREVVDCATYTNRSRKALTLWMCVLSLLYCRQWNKEKKRAKCHPVSRARLSLPLIPSLIIAPGNVIRVVYSSSLWCLVLLLINNNIRLLNSHNIYSKQ